MENTIPSLLKSNGIIHSVLPGRIAFHFNGKDYRFLFSKDCTASLHDINGKMSEDCTTITEVESVLNRLKNPSKKETPCHSKTST